MIQTILGSGGSIGLPLARELQKFTDHIRLVSRNPVRVNATDELFPADLGEHGQIDKAIEGSKVVYVTIGFEYNTRVWQSTWSPFMQEVIHACMKYCAKLVFFDNVYMYAETEIPFMTEDSGISPSSRKGKVRAKLDEMIMEAVEKKNLTALIARSADFYGPDCKNSPLAIMVAENLMKGKKAQAFGNINKIHTYTYTPDAASATAILGNTSDAYNQTWHVPTTKENPTTLQWMEMVATGLNRELKVQKLPAWMLQFLGIFIPVLREFPEMLYQYEQDYIFDSSKFEKRFGIVATPPGEGIGKMIEYLQKRDALPDQKAS